MAQAFEVASMFFKILIARLLYSKLMDEYLIAHFRVFEHLVPAHDLYIEVDVNHPMKPA